MSLFETLTLSIAVVSAVMALVSLIRTRRLDERQERLRVKQDELLDLQLSLLRREVEQQSTLDTPPADVRVTLEKSAPRDTRFEVTNWGHGTARDVKFDIITKDDRSSPIIGSEYNDKFPIPELMPGSSIRLIAALTFGTGTTFDVVLTWIDPDGSPQRREQRVSL